MQACTLDKVVFMPERRPRGKQNVTDIAHRVALIERAIQTEDSLRVLQVHTDQFTVRRTLPELRSIFADAHLILLAGSDVVHTFAHSWNDLDTLFSEVSLAVGMRSNDDVDEISSVLAAVEATYGIAISYTCISTPEAHLTSSQIRAGIASLPRLPHPSMLEYIHEHGLYPQS
jgi:nicotinate (nicotinamide) nucleotide adenylyltransferase